MSLPDTTQAMMQTEYFEVEQDEDLAIVWLDQKGRSVNTLSSDALSAFDEALDQIEKESSVSAVIFISRKENSFIVGADVRELQTMDTPDDVEALSRQAHRLLSRMHQLPLPTVSAIHGPAMGGGLELALSTTYRIATDERPTKLALPEVKLGLLPGGGGTQYLPRLLGLQKALPLLLTGKNVYPSPARKMGLVDLLTHRDGLLHAAKQAARDLASGQLSPDDDRRGLGNRLLESNPLSRRLVYRRAASRLRQETRGNYPAPFKIMECVATGLEDGLTAGLEAEAKAFGELAFTPETRQLLFLFFAKQDAEKSPQKEDARPVSTLGVLGGGLMGAGIAQVSATAGLNVLLKDQSLDLAAEAKRKVWQSTQRKVKKGALSSFEHDVLTARVTPVADYASLSQAELVIEAVPEDLATKHDILKEAEAVLPSDSLFASNTSSIPISDIAQASAHPETVLGMHYFSPVPSIPLLEIIKTDQTADWAVATARAVGLRQGKTVIVVNDGPGFYTTRILAIYMNEALLMLEEGGDARQIDEAMEQFGFPMGPYELFDLIGIDTAAKITGVLSDFFDKRDASVTRSSEKLVEAGLTGQKSGRGFYEYDTGGAGRPDKGKLNDRVYRYFGGKDRQKLNPELIQQRLALTMINEAIHCLGEGILTSPKDGDVGAVFGLGFPPFRGGPFRYVDAENAPAVIARMDRLRKAYGERFTPAPLLQEHAHNDTSFYAGER